MVVDLESEIYLISYTFLIFFFPHPTFYPNHYVLDLSENKMSCLEGTVCVFLVVHISDVVIYEEYGSRHFSYCFLLN